MDEPMNPELPEAREEQEEPDAQEPVTGEAVADAEAGPRPDAPADAQPEAVADTDTDTEAQSAEPRDDAVEPAPAEPPQEAAVVPVQIDIVHVKRVLEAALLSARDPLTVQQLKRLFGGEVDADNIRKVLDELKDEWSERSIELTSVASGWRFRVKPEYQKFLDRITSEKPPRYTRAVLETLAIIAYRQPVTRGDIEDVRGVAVSPATLSALTERGWVEVVGHRETPGRPAIFATTKKFLDDLNLRSLEELPPLEQLQAALEPATPALPSIDAAPQPPEQESLIEPETPQQGGADGEPADDDAEPQTPDSTEQAHAG
jgi:segregation and condensation protein B